MGSLVSKGDAPPASTSRRDILLMSSTVDPIIDSASLVMFSGSWCPYCKKALAAMTEAGYTPEVIEITDEYKAELSKKTGKTSVPQVFINGTVSGGASQNAPQPQ
mmetsp:Transcript_45810/g.127150  ORF Transcript_45810/g.127150 Transcript_45810/m.127150 type:complete len:105 (+) Transcript_45810:149-463(+)